MNLKQKLKKEFKEITPADCFKVAAIIIIVYCGLKLFMLFYMEYVASLILIAVFLEQQGKTEFINKLPLVLKWSGYYLQGLIIGVVSYLSINAVIHIHKGLKTKRGK